MSLFEKMAAGLGGMVGAYHKARLDRLNPQRPRMLSDWAAGERWKGGDLGARDEAQRRAWQNSWFFGASRIKAEEVSAAEFEVVINAPGSEPLVVKNHPFDQLMRRPNPVMGRAFTWQFTQMWLDSDGKAYWLILPDAQGYPAEIWPLPSNQVNPVTGDADRPIDYYEFSAGGPIYRINAEYVCYFRMPHPFEPFGGLSSLAAGMLPIDSDNAMAYWNGSLFGENNVMPSVVINLSSGDPASPIEQADLQAVKDQLQAEYQAWMRKTVVTGAFKMDVNPVGWSQKDADFLAGRQFSKEEILFILGVPAGLMDKNATEANATVAKAQLKERVWAELVLLAEQLNAQVIMPFYGEQFELRFRDIRLANRQMELQEDAASREVLTLDERRARYYGAPALPDGRGTKTALELQSAQAPAADPGPLGGLALDIPRLDALPPTNQLPEQAKSDLRRWRDRTVKAAKAGKSLTDPFLSQAIPLELTALVQDGLEAAQTAEDVKAVFQFATKGIVRSWRPWSMFEEKLTEVVAGFLENEAQRMIDDMQAAGTPGVLNDPQWWTEHKARLLEQIQPVLLDLARQATGRVKQTLGESGLAVDWNLANERAAQWATDHAAQLVRQVADTTKREIANQVTEWARSSEGLDGLINRIAGLTDDDAQPIFNRMRAERIAVTEATNTYAGANAQAWAAAGYAPAVYKPAGHVNCRCYLQPYLLADGTKVLVWYTARDERVCSRPLKTPWGQVAGCRALHKTIVSEGPMMGKKVE